MPSSRREFLRNAASAGTVGGTLALAGCAALEPSNEVATVVVPSTDEVRVGVTVYPGSVEHIPHRTRVTAMGPACRRRWTRNYDYDRWPGSDGFCSGCRLGDDTLFVGYHRAETSLTTDGLGQRVSRTGESRWRAVFPETGAFVDATPADDGAVLVGFGPHPGGCDPYVNLVTDAWLSRVTDEGETRWTTTVPHSAARTVTIRDDRLLVGGHAIPSPPADGRGNLTVVPWLAALDPSGEVLWQRRYTASGFDGLTVVDAIPVADGLVIALTTATPADDDSFPPRIVRVGARGRIRSTVRLSVPEGFDPPTATTSENGTADTSMTGPESPTLVGLRHDPANDGFVAVMTNDQGNSIYAASLAIGTSAQSGSHVVRLDDSFGRRRVTPVAGEARSMLVESDGGVVVGRRQVGKNDTDAWAARVDEHGTLQCDRSLTLSDVPS